MGNSSSAKVDNSFFSRLAYQVVHVVKESPAERCGLMPYCDFLTHLPPIRTFTDCPLPYDEYVRDAIGSPLNDQGQPRSSTQQAKSLELTVFSCASARMRKVHLQPERYSKARLDLTGFLFRPVIISEAISSVEHVQEISVGSPASVAGLVPHFDYIIATDEGNCSDLHQIVQPHSADQSNRLRIYVVDVFLKASRIVDVPGIKKLGERRLGCTLASGYLHRIPTNFPLTFHLICDTTEQRSYSRSGSSSFSRPLSRATSVAEGTALEKEVGVINNGHHHCGSSNSEHHHHHHHHDHDSNSTDCDLAHQQNRKAQKPSSPLPLPQLTEPLDPNSCVFETCLQLKDGTVLTPTLPFTEPNKMPTTTTTNAFNKNENASTSQVMPISVQIPKEIVANVVAELVRYQKEHQQSLNGCQQPYQQKQN